MASMGPARIGGVLILMGVAWIGGWFWWRDTRVWRPLDVPVTISPEQFRVSEFEVNVEARYLVGVVVANGVASNRVRCWLGVDDCSDLPAVVGARWTIWKRERLVDSGTSESSRETLWTQESIGRKLGEVDLPRGRYILQLEGLEDGSKLSEFSPRMMVVETGDVYWWSVAAGQHVVITFIACVGIGLSLMVLSAGAGPSAFARAHSLTQPGPQLPLPGSGLVPPEIAARHKLYARLFARVRHAKMKAPFPCPFFRVSWFSQPVATVFLILITPMFVILPPLPVGLKIRLREPEIEHGRMPGLQPLRIYVGYDGHQPIVTVDSQAVSWDDFATVLKRELWRRPPNWPVYLDGDRDMEWGNAVRAMDVINGFGAQVVLLTR
jgi:biopolymer transport protein ExbD